MKILFICRANVGRSQMAEAIFNSLTSDHIASSAGLNPPPQWEGQKLSKTKYVAPCLLEIGLDVSENISKRLSEKHVAEADHIIVIGEKNNWPDFLTKQNVKYWGITDPDTGEMELHRSVRDEITILVKQLLSEI